MATPRKAKALHLELNNINYAVFPEGNETYTIYKEGKEYVQIQKDDVWGRRRISYRNKQLVAIFMRKKLDIFINCSCDISKEIQIIGIIICIKNREAFIHKIEKLIRQQIPVLNIPEKVFIEETSYEERQAIAKQIDEQKRKDDPDFKGAFHEKKTLTQRNKFKAARAKAGGEKMSAAKKKKYK